MMKRIMSLALVLLLLMTILAVPAFADENISDGSGTSQVDNSGSDTDSGNTGNDNTNSGNTDGGNTDGGNTDGGNTDGGNTDGGNTDGGNTDGGNTDGGNTDGGNTDGGNTDGGNTDGGNTGGGSTDGGNTGGGSTDGDNSDDDLIGGDSTCKHEWIYVEVDPTCTEYGAKGYYCHLCEGVSGVVAIDLAPHTYDNVCDDDCNVCKATREVEHKFSTQWSKNSTKHWYTCAVCGEKDGVADHYPGPAATEEKAQYCLTCGLQMMPKKSHTHIYATAMTSDATGHWYACSGCEEKKDFSAHTYDDLCDPDCNTCGFTSETAHSFDDNWESDENGHWAVCALCGEEKASEAHVPGPEATDTEAQLCTLCGWEIAPALVHVHEAGAVWQSDETSHWHNCDCGEKMDLADHTWDEGVENEDTTVTYVCTACQAEKTEGEPKTASEFPMWILFLGIAILCGIAAVVLILIMVIRNKPGKYKN